MWSPDGQYIATINHEAGGEAGWPVLRLLDFQSGAEQAYLRGGIFADWRMAFDPQGKFIVTLVNSFTSIDGQPGELALWNVDDILKRHDVYNTQANYLQLQQNYIPASTITFMPGTSLFAVAEQNTITLMDETRKPIQTFNGDWDYVSQLIFSPDGSLVVASVEKFIPNSGDGTPDQTEAVGIYIWRTDDGERVKFMPYPSYIGNLAFSPDGSLLVVVDFRGQANIYETLTDRILKTFAVREVTVGQWRGSSIRNLQFNADGTLLISAIGDGIKLWGVKP
jgi:dipeptidyl aminopeptidase/acylaminoacyl peptidase